MDFVFITDTHFNNTSNVRTGDLLDDCVRKLDFVVDYTNKHDATLLLGGDVFDKSQVSDKVKNRIATCLKRLKYKAFAIEGNHDRRYDNSEYFDQTSLGNLVITGVVRLLTEEEYPEVHLTSIKPMKTIGKPQIGMFHGFLNVEDGQNTVYLSDLMIKDNALALLGHDHLVYDPLVIGTVKVIRPGSFLRGIRNDTQLRDPKLVHIKVINGELKIKHVSVEGRDCAEIFKTKKVTISKADRIRTYDKIINQIRNSESNDMSLNQALNAVATPDVVAFADQLLNDYNVKNTK